MKQRVQRTIIAPCRTANHVFSRRLTLRCSGLAVLGLVSHAAFAQTGEKTTEARRSGAKPSQRMQETMEQSQAFTQRLHNASGMEESLRIMNEQTAWQRQRAFDDLKDQLGLSDQEWPVVKARLQTVYDLVHPRPPMMGRSEPPKTEVEQVRRALRELLREEEAPADQIKAGLTTLRAARERTVQELVRARQNLRQVMTLRQEALLVLNGLLD